MKQAIINTLQKSLLANTQLLAQADKQLQLLSQAQIVVPLMEIVANRNMEINIRQSALVLLKQSVQNRWKRNPIFKDKNKVYLTQNEKTFMKNNILPLFLQCESVSQFNKLHQYIISTIVKCQHKQWMPTNQLISIIQSMEMNICNVERILEFISCVSEGFETMDKNQFYTNFCQRVLPIFQKYLGSESTLKILHLISKILWRAVNSVINPYFQQKADMWISFMKFIIDLKQLSYHSFIEKNHKNSTTNVFHYFHAKKWIMRCLMKIMLPQTQNRLPPSFKALFFQKWLSSFIIQTIQNLSIPCIQKQRYFQLRFLYHSLKKQPQEIRKFIVQLQYKKLIPFITCNKQDYVLIRNSPLEYLSKQQDNCWGFTNVRQASLDLWVKLVNSQSISNNLVWISEKIKSINIQEIEVGLSILINMSILENQLTMSIIAPALQYLTESLNNGEILIKYRVLQLIIRYPRICLSSNLLQSLLSTIVKYLITPSNLLITLKSLQSLNQLVSNNDQAINLIKPLINSILRQLLNVISTPDSQDIVPILYRFVLNLKDHLKEYILDLFGYFSEQFLRFSKQFNDIQSNDGTYDAKIEDAALSCLNILNVLLQLANVQNLSKIQPFLIKVMEQCFVENGLQYYDDGLELLNTYIYMSDNINPCILFFYPCVIYRIIGIPNEISYQNVPKILERQFQIFECLKNNSNIQAIQKSLPLLRNFIYKHPLIISDNTDFFNNNFSSILLELIRKILSKHPSNSYDWVDILSVWSLVMYLMQNCKQDSFIKDIIKITYNQNIISEDSDTYLKNMACQLWCTCAFRQPQSMLSIIDLNLIKIGIKHCNLKYQKKRIVIGLSTIISKQSILQKFHEYQTYLVQIVKALTILINKKQQYEVEDEDEQQDYQFSQKLDTKFISNISNLNENQYLESCLTIFKQRTSNLTILPN